MQFLRRCAVGGTAQFFARKYNYVQPFTLTASRQLLPDLLAQPQNDSKTFESIEAIRRYPVVSLWCTVGFHSSAAALAAQDVVVPSMGDSITEGTIVNVSKSKGDSVEEDEVIAQIETDKVTIDVRAPSAGTLTDVLVSDDQNVEVGEVIARLDDAGNGQGISSSGSSDVQEEGGAKATPTPHVGSQSSDSKRSKVGGQQGASTSTSQGAEDNPPSSQSSSRGGVSVEAGAEPVAKVGGEPMKSMRPQPAGDRDSSAPPDGRAHLVFPPRRTEDGLRISDMPPAEAEYHTERLSGSSDGDHQQERQQGGQGRNSQLTADTTGSESEGVMRRRWAVGAPLPHDEDWQPAPGKWALSEIEMEMIDLGGAEP